MIGIVVTTKLKNVVRMKGIVTMIAIAKLASSAALITVQVVSHHTMTAVIKNQVIQLVLIIVLLLQHQRIHHVVTKKLKNVERMKVIVTSIVIAKLVSSAAPIIVQVVFHQTMTAVIKNQVLFIVVKL